MNLIALVLLRSLHLILVLLRLFGVVVLFRSLEEPDSFSADTVAVFSIIFIIVLTVNNSETHVTKDVLIDEDWPDHKRLTKVVDFLDLWTSWLSNKEEASLRGSLVLDTVSSRASQS